MDDGVSSYHRFLQGDEQAFDEILTLYRDKLLFFIHRYVRNLSVAEDLAEDTFVELLIHTYREERGASLKTYLFTIARNKALNYLKCAGRHREQSLEQSSEAALLADDRQLEERILHEERQQRVNMMLNQLSPDYRAVLHLLYFEELSYEEAGKVLKKKRKQIENLAYRARQAARTVWEKDGWKDEKL